MSRAMIVIALVLALAVNTYAKMPCIFVSDEGYLYNISRLTLVDNYRGSDARYTYLANFCGPVHEAKCQEFGGVVCIYDRTPTYVNTLARDTDPTWRTLTPNFPDSGLAFRAENGFYSSMSKALVTVNLKCDPQASGALHELTVDQSSYNISTFVFSLTTPFACPLARTIISVPDFTIHWEHPEVAVPIILNTLPASNLTVSLSHDYLMSTTVTFFGPANGRTTTLRAIVKLLDNLKLTHTEPISIQAKVTVGGYDFGRFAFPQKFITITIPAVPDTGSSISGGSVFLILFFVGGFVYIAGGCAFNIRKNGAGCGMQSFPNIGFWTDVFDYARAGVSYATCGRLCASGTRAYSGF